MRKKILYATLPLLFVLFYSGVVNAAVTQQIAPTGVTTKYEDGGKKLSIRGPLGNSSNDEVNFVYNVGYAKGDENCALEDAGNACADNPYVLEGDSSQRLSATTRLCNRVFSLGDECTSLNKEAVVIPFIPKPGISIDNAVDEIIEEGSAAENNVIIQQSAKYLFVAIRKQTGPVVNVNYYVIEPTGSLSSGGVLGGYDNGKDWIDTEGNIVDLDEFASDRFKFISPFEFVDTKNTYKNTGKFIVYRLADNANMSGDANDRLLDNGMQFYWPIKEDSVLDANPTELDFISKETSNKPINQKKCVGGIAVRSSDGDGYGQMYAIPTFTYNQSCFVTKDAAQFKDLADVSSLRRSFGSGSADIYNKSVDNSWEITSEMRADSDKNRSALWFANFRWQDPSTIRAYKGSKPDEGPVITRWGGPNDTTHDADFVLDEIGKTGEIFTNTECSFDNLGKPDYLEAFILVQRDTTNKNIQDTDTSSNNAATTVYVKEGKTWQPKWVNTKVDCLIGHQVEDNAVQRLFPNERAPTGDDDNGAIGRQYIAYPSRSVEGVNDGPGNVGNADAGFVGDPLEEGGNSSELDCKWSLTNPLSWIMCPLIEGAKTTVGKLDKEIRNNMTIDLTSASSPYNESAPRTSGRAVYEAWSTIRTLSLAFLVIIVIVMLISQAISIGPFDAYTVKKVLPRIVGAVILTTFSWQIAKLGVAISNYAGQGVGTIISTPFSNLENSNINSLGGGTGLIGIGVALLQGVDLFVVFSLAMTAFAAVLIAFFTIAFRNILIMALVMTAPLAIIAWILPNTQKVWGFWKSSFLGALMAFPIIVAFITSGRVFAQITTNTASESIFRDIIVFMSYFGPYFAIPAAFRMAGGAVAQISGIANDRSKGFFDKQKKSRQNTMAQNKERRGRVVLQKRAEAVNALQNSASKDGRKWLTKRALGGASRVIGGYNVEAAASGRRAAVQKEMNDQIATGIDDEIRGLTVNKRAATIENGLKRIKDGKVQYKSLAGAWVDEAKVDAAHKRWGNDQYAQQTALSYEMRKAMTDEQVQDVGRRYGDLARDSWGLSDYTAKGMLKGAGFENQNQHLEFKHMRLDGSIDYDAFTQEMYEKKGSYPLSQMSAHTVERLREAYASADTSTEEGRKRSEQVRDIAETFVQRGGARAPGMVDVDGAPTPAMSPSDGPVLSGPQVYSSGSASVNQAVAALAFDTGVLTSEPNRPVQPIGSNREGTSQKNPR